MVILKELAELAELIPQLKKCLEWREDYEGDCEDKITKRSKLKKQ